MPEKLQGKIEIGNHVAWRLIGDEVVIVDSRSSEMFTLNGTGSAIWMHMVHDTPLSGIVTALAAEYEVSDDEARTDILVFVAEMKERGLILENASLPEIP